MKRITNWLLSHRRWIVLVTLGIPLLTWVGWALTHKTVALLVFIIIWFTHLGLGVVAVMAGVRVWRSRHIPFFNYLWFYLNAFVIDVLSAIVLLFMVKGVVLTWKFSAVMFISTLLMDVVRVPLLFSIIRGPTEDAVPVESKETETSGNMPLDFWLNESQKMLEVIRQIIREEIAAASGTTTVTVKGPSATATEGSESAPKEN